MDLTPTLRLNLPAFAFEPWDDEVNDNFDVLDAFVGSVVGFANYAGIWTNATAYTVGQQVIDTNDSSFWGCNISHTSAAAPATFATDRTNHPSYWGLRQNSAKQYAEQAAASAASAAASAQAAQAAYDAIMPDAPRNDFLYGRINGTWQQAVAIDSPIFTGDPRAPTPPLTDNDTSIATTAFVKGLVGASAAFVTISDTPPVSPSIGSLWWDDIGGQLYVYYRDIDTYQWVAVNSATGGMGTGFMQIVGGTFTGPVMMFRDPLALTEAATKRYVDNTVNNKSYPYLLLSSVPSQTVTSPVAITGTLSVSSTLTASGAANVAGNLTTNGILGVGWGIPTGMGNGIVNSAGEIVDSHVSWNVYVNNNVGQWQRRRAGVGALMYLDPGAANGLPSWTFYTVDNGGTGVTAGLNGAFSITNSRVISERDFVGRGNVWAANFDGVFGLVSFSGAGGNYYGVRFDSNGWRLEFNRGTGSLTYIRNDGVLLFAISGGGDLNMTGAFYAGGQVQSGGPMFANGGVYFHPQNGWEYHTYVEGGSGDHIVYHRTGSPGEQWYERWRSSGGATAWIKGTREVMTLNDGTLSVIDRISTGGTVHGGYLECSGDVYAGGAHTGSRVTVGGDVQGSACYFPNGVFVGGAADTTYGFYNSGGTRIFNFNPNKYWGCNAGNGDLNYYIDTMRMISIWRYSAYAGTNLAVHNPNFGGGFIGYQFIQAYGRSVPSRSITTAVPGLKELMKIGFIESTTEASENVPARRTLACRGEDLVEVLPEVAWSYDGDDGKGHATSLGALLAVAVSAIKELGARVIALEARNGA